MELDRFIEEIRRKLQGMSGGDYRFEAQEIDGLNGTVRHLLMAVQAGADICPCINMDSCYRQYQSGADMDGLAEDILESCRGNAPVCTEFISNFVNWDFAEGRIFARLINTEKNGELLRQHPNRPYLDLSLVYYVRVTGKHPGEYGAVQIRNEHMRYWGVSESVLYRTAWRNILRAGEAVLERMEDILYPFCREQALYMDGGTIPSMYVLGNRNRVNGAVQMCNPAVLRKAAETVGGDFWILPSSIHELILVPLQQDGNDAKTLMEIVKEVNCTQVEPRDILSFHVYRYCMAEGELEIAA